MRPFTTRPIGQKLAIVIVATLAIALVLAGVGLLVADSFLFRRTLRQDLTMLARVIAYNSTAALAFNDSVAAATTLEALKARAHVAGACIYRDSPNADTPLFAQYASNQFFACPEKLEPQASTSFDSLTLTEPIVLDGKDIGTLLLAYDLDELTERLIAFGAAVIAVFIVASIIAFILSSKLRAAIVSPIARLVEATSTVSLTGNYGIRAERVSGDELGVLVDYFNEMLAGIQSRDNEMKAVLRNVEEERARFHFLAESMPQKIFTATTSGDVDYFNAQWIEYTGLDPERMRGWGWKAIVHPDDLEGNIHDWEESLRTGKPLAVQQRFLRHDGKYRWHLTRIQAMRDGQGQIMMWIGSNTDIHEQKETEEELRRANEDLQQFAYSASHDLQEPIRNVSIYSDLVARRYAASLDDEGRLFLGFLKEGGHRLTTLVTDLLAYTRASMGELSERPVDASAVLNEVQAILADVIRESEAVITATALPRIHMSDLHLQQLFQNLIGNAIKYRSDEPPRIGVSAEKSREFWRFAVQDNGIGIDPEYTERIFGVFKRLSHDRGLEGNGIGLAICQRIVQRYGGQIWVESKLGSGSIFFFTVPIRPGGDDV